MNRQKTQAREWLTFERNGAMGKLRTGTSRIGNNSGLGLRKEFTFGKMPDLPVVARPSRIVFPFLLGNICPVACWVLCLLLRIFFDFFCYKSVIAFVATSARLGVGFWHG